jgi:hypothetical protein
MRIHNRAKQELPPHRYGPHCRNSGANKLGPTASMAFATRRSLGPWPADQGPGEPAQIRQFAVEEIIHGNLATSPAMGWREVGRTKPHSRAFYARP